MQTKSDDIIVPNVWGDLVDSDFVKEAWRINDDGSYANIELNPEFFNETAITLKPMVLGKFRAEVDGKAIIDQFFTLSDYISKIPHGIVDKKRPGIGATTVEINSRRNSIIVLPTKILAYNKSLKHPHCLYVGSKVKDNNTVNKADITKYLNNSEFVYKKILVVADSLKKVIEAIELNGEDIYSQYFLLVDEVDMLQSDANYRPALENVMDHYFKFNIKNRCLLTATMREFSNPRLQYETRFDLTDYRPKRDINVIHSNNINATVKSEIEKHTDGNKVLIAYNSITQIMGIIYNLDTETQKKCAILCSEASEKETAGYYAELQNNKLPNTIVFATCSYFAGIDIDDSYHLITVSNANRFFQILSVDKMTQIAGRCRIENGLLSETIVYNTPKNVGTLNNGTFQENLLNKAHKIIELYNAADEISKFDVDLTNLFAVVKKAIQDKSTERVGGEEISLTRQNINGEFVPAYFNIDSLVEKLLLDSGYYMIPSLLKKELAKSHNILNYKSVLTVPEESQLEAEAKSTERQKLLFDSYLEEAKIHIKQLETHGELDDTNLKKAKQHCKRNAKAFYDRFIKLYKYADVNIILDLLWDIRAENKKSFKGINNAVIFWALENDHPFKSDITNNIIPNDIYLARDLHAILIPITEYHLHKKIKPRAAISLIKAFYKLERPRTKYKVISENPKAFTEHKLRIGKNENLIGYFMI